MTLHHQCSILKKHSPSTALCPFTRLPMLGEIKLSRSLLAPSNGLGLLLGACCSPNIPYPVAFALLLPQTVPTPPPIPHSATLSIELLRGRQELVALQSRLSIISKLWFNIWGWHWRPIMRGHLWDRRKGAVEIEGSVEDFGESSSESLG